ncbi:PREDICTED: protein EMSY-LIKE 3-like isoform X2 [Ipomoea nil]|nr:PREDICTED: protein EMSY-LIKE 3-like isoform X2 [Ipomoea nil]
MHSDMEAQIHNLEQEAYGAVLRAFKAQSDALTWEKEGLITELRKELRVSDDEHRDLLTKVNADDLIQRIREWRKVGGNQPVHDQLASPTISGSRKRQRTSQPLHLPFGPSSESLHHQSIAPSTQPSTPAAKWGPTSGSGGINHKPLAGHGSSSTIRSRHPLVGRKVMTRWPEDTNFYEAVISDYNPVDGRHALVYDANAPNETWEWVDLKEIPPDDIRWIGDDPVISRGGGCGGGGGGGGGGSVQGSAFSIQRGGSFSRDQCRKEVRPVQNGVMKKAASDEIEILHTETLIKKVEKVIDASPPNLIEIQKAKKMLKDHEKSLMDVIAKLADACDRGNDGQQILHRNSQYNHLRVDIDPETRGRGSSQEMARVQGISDQQDEEIVVI